MAKAAKKTPSKASKKGKKGGVPIFLIFGVLTGIVLLPSTVLLLIGMLPTVVAFFIDTSKRKTRAVTVGAMNFAGCSPFLIELWKSGHSMDSSLEIATQPMAVIVMYAASGVGYVIDWAMSGVVSTILYQRGLSRRKAIERRQEELIDRWGREVTGDFPLDEYGFALDMTPGQTSKPQQKPKKK